MSVRGALAAFQFLQTDEKQLVQVRALGFSFNRLAPYTGFDELLAEVLKQKHSKHFHQLQYLAERHNKSVLKLRFVLMPFSFVFLLNGEKQFHVIWETLDTEEATFIWHVEKNNEALKEKLALIDKDLGFVRNKGRQAFTETNPLHFSRIIHDYTEPYKGFVIWKDQLEEQLS